MARRVNIRVFEYQKLLLKPNGFTDRHVQRLLKWNDANGNKYFQFGLNSIRFTQYVGVIQVGNMVLQVLPKADRKEADTPESKDRWQEALLTMLRSVYDLPLTSTTESHLHKRKSSILDFFFGLFLSDVEDLVRRGLVKRYRRTKENCNALKGRIDFPRHIQQNLVHQERFFVEHQVYDIDHLLHALLKEAVALVKSLAQDPSLSARADRIQWAFENVRDQQLDQSTLNRIILDRRTEPYARAVQLAKMIVLSHSPDIKGGHMPLIGLMFDMNVLFERFVYRQLRKAQPNFAAHRLVVRGQAKQVFWQKKTIRPDIILEYMKDSIPQRVVVDTKWKVPANGKPSDDDLKQMFVYNVQFDASRSILLYPRTATSNPVTGIYTASKRLVDWPHDCQMDYADFFDTDGAVRKSSGMELLKKIM